MTTWQWIGTLCVMSLGYFITRWAIREIQLLEYELDLLDREEEAKSWGPW